MNSRMPLNFSVFPIATREDLEEVCQIRARAYGHHLPELGGAMEAPDELDLAPDTTVFLVRDKATGAGLGSARVQVGGHRPLMIEQCIPMPDAFNGQDFKAGLRAEISRLCVKRGAHGLVKMALYKATFLACLSNQVKFMIAGARDELLARQYKRLGFTELLEGREFPLSYAGGRPHKCLAFDVQCAERNWHQAQHEFYTFMFELHHPDISMFVPRAMDRFQRHGEAMAA